MYKAYSRFLRKMTFQNMYTFLHNGFSEILNLSYFAHPLRSFSKAPPPPSNSLQKIDLSYHQHIAHSHVKSLPMYSFLCLVHLFYVILPPSVTFNFTVYSQPNNHSRKFCILRLILMYLSLGAHNFISISTIDVLLHITNDTIFKKMSCI